MNIFEKIAENRIQEAIEEGQFDRLTNKGQPLHLEEYFATPAAFRVGHSVLKNANILPAEMDLLRDIGRLQEQLEAAADESTQQQLRRERNEKELQLRLLLERNNRRA